MNRMRITATGKATVSAMALMLCPALAAAQPAWPSKPLRLAPRKVAPQRLLTAHSKFQLSQH